MRPPEFTGGNIPPLKFHLYSMPSFNEAAGIHRRKLMLAQRSCHSLQSGFNEAAGIHRRKRVRAARVPGVGRRASMRPPEFTGGNQRNSHGRIAHTYTASMRPPEFTGGNRQLEILQTLDPQLLQ